ncbi:DUF2158 domain-containing protein [Paraburkholderia strydomiana]|uniref:DUF2158 domain-containing protein n=1 Tax=Paraburkholderia strydomiana TaxID=1245417 RepID=A0ABW9C1G9_9BURK
MPVAEGGGQRAGGGAIQLNALRAQYKGKKVKLKSGGPEMTVNEILPGPFGAVLACAWFNGTDLSKDTFSPEAIELAP